ncbi:MAG TPA: SDR family NAD(P)-dependent oxidoreductase [Actinopolymorphaceae bacterium]|jgi:short-subunit dehydrogenase
MARALITGGSSGIGAAFAKALAARGDDLTLVARDAVRLEEFAAGLRAAHGVDVEVFPADLGVRADVSRVAARLADDASPIDMLVNNAGFGIGVRLTADDLGAHEHAIDVMVRAVLILGGTAGRTMRARGHGAIVNISSVAGMLAMGGYSAIKAWVTAYSESLAAELGGTGVTVTALLPGWVRTEFHDRAAINTTRLPGAAWVDADALVHDCLDDVAKGRVLSVPTVRYRAVTGLLRHAPRGLVRKVSTVISSSRHKD